MWLKEKACEVKENRSKHKCSCLFGPADFRNVVMLSQVVQMPVKVLQKNNNYR